MSTPTITTTPPGAQDVAGLSLDSILSLALDTLRNHDGDREAGAAFLRRAGGTPYDGPGAQMSDRLIPRLYHLAADVLQGAALPGPMPYTGHPIHRHAGQGYNCGCPATEKNPHPDGVVGAGRAASRCGICSELGCTSNHGRLR